MTQRLSDFGCRWRIYLVLLNVVLAVLVSAGNENTTIGDTKTGISSTIASTSTVVVTTKATTPRGKNKFKECKMIEAKTSITELLTKCGSRYSIKSEHTLDFSSETESDIEKLFSSLKDKKLEVDIKISKSKIKKINFGNVEEIGDDRNQSISLFLTNNKNLQTIVRNGSDTFHFNGKITVRGNRLLDDSSLALFLPIESEKDIQEEKECFQDDTLDFYGCERIYGDLTLTNFKDSNFIPKAISGCLTLKGNDDDLDVRNFLKDFNGSKHDNASCTNEISGYCLKKEVQKEIEEKFKGRKITISKANNCEFACTQREIFDVGQDKCTKIIGDISVTQNTTAEQKKLLNLVTEIHGIVAIDGVGDTSINFFSKLRLINSTNSTAPALTIINNAQATSMSLNVLSKVVSPAKNKFIFERNGFNCTPYKDTLRIALGTNVNCGEKVEKPIMTDTETSTTAEVNSQKEKTVNQNGKSDKSEESGLGGGWIALIVIAVVTVLIVSAGVVGVVLFFRWRNKKKEKKHEEEKKDKEAELLKKEKIIAKEREMREEEDKKEEQKLHQNQNADMQKMENVVNKMANNILLYTFTDPKGKVHTGYEGYKNFYKKNQLYHKMGRELEKGEPTINNTTFEKYPKLGLYGDVLCLEENRVKVTFKELEHDFIHANHIDFSSFGCKDKYIAAQYPICKAGEKEVTVHRFFSMLMEYEVPVVVQLQGFEDGEYIPITTGNAESDFFRVQILSTENVPVKNPVAVLRKVKLIRKEKSQGKEKEKKSQKEKKTWTFDHYEITNWPDKNVPQGGLYGTFKTLYDLVVQSRTDKEKPVVVHCRAGVGRTMSLIVVFHIISSFMQNPEKTPSDIVALFKHARLQRYLGIQTMEQFMMIPSVYLDMISGKCKDQKLIKQMREFVSEFLNSADDMADYEDEKIK